MTGPLKPGLQFVIPSLANVTQMGWQEVKHSQSQRYLDRETNFSDFSSAEQSESGVKSLLQTEA